MYSKSIVIQNKTGLHARPANKFVNIAKDFKSHITIKKGEKSGDAKSMLNVLAMCISMGSTVELTAEGADEQDAVETLIKYISELVE